jgi:hypothetical protein
MMHKSKGLRKGPLTAIAYGKNVRESLVFVGEGATIAIGSDRYPATVIKVTPCRVTVQRDSFIRTDNNGFSESQEYEYSACPDGEVTVFYKTPRGFQNGCYRLSLGGRRAYMDPSF